MFNERRPLHLMLAAMAHAVAWNRPVSRAAMTPSIEDILKMPDLPDLTGLNGSPSGSKKYALGNGKYFPHQGLKERARRQRQMAKIAAKGD